MPTLLQCTINDVTKVCPLSRQVESQALCQFRSTCVVGVIGVAADKTRGKRLDAPTGIHLPSAKPSQ